MGLDVTYKGQQIAQLTEDGNLTLKTAGKYCEGDIELAYSGGGGTDPDLAVFDYSKFTGAQSPTSYYFANSCTQKKIKVILPDSYSGTNPCFTNATSQLEEVEIQTNGTITSMTNGPIVYNSYIKHITLNFLTANVNAAGWNAYVFRHAGRGTGNSCRIDGQPIDFSGVAADTAQLATHNWMFYQANISYVRFKPNTLNMSGTACLAHGLTGERSVADEESMISTLNVLGETTTGTVQWINSMNLRRSQIESCMGYDDTSNGYHLFVKDPNGTLSLADFVTQVKGWTLT